MSAAGTWKITTKSPMGSQEGTLKLDVDGDRLTGTMSAAQGSMELQNGKIDGNDLSWSAKMTSPMPMTLEFRASVDGDAISGTVKLGAFGNATFEGRRA
jgi:hypothetical protein